MTASIVSAPYVGNHTFFLSGPPGAGKTTLGVQRLQYLLDQGIPAEQILILVPQRTLATPYYEALHSPHAPAGGVVDVATIGGLARRTIELFWPLVADPAGFAHEARLRPRFLTLETTQYYMDQTVQPFFGAGAFDGVTIARPRLVSQVIDNLNKAAAVGFPLDEIAARLKSAWSGESARLRIYDQVQEVALAFREMCLRESLLDWSLQIEVFWRYLLPLPQFRRYLLGGYRHLIVDNVEEDIPATHDLLREWLPLCESALVIYDREGGYRVFLGADPGGALALASLCRENIRQTGSFVTSPEVAALGVRLATYLAGEPFPPASQPDQAPVANARQVLRFRREPLRFHPQMLDWVVDEVARLVMEDGLPPGQVAVLAPFLSDALRFSLTEKLQRYNIAVRTHRPSRQLQEEPAVRCLLTLAKLAHPEWQRPPPAADVAQALGQAIGGVDPVRAALLTSIVYRVRDGKPSLVPFYELVPEAQQRISYQFGGRYGEVWRWIEDYRAQPAPAPQEAAHALDYFLSRLFGELLSQPGFGFHRNLDAGAMAANLIESVQKFRQSFAPLGDPEGDSTAPPGLEYLDMVERGVVAAQYVSSWQIQAEDALLLVPAYTFLMMNQPVSVQFWLDAGSRAWFERIYQPLTHPYVLRRDWPSDEAWTDQDEVRVQKQAIARLVLGLARRCRERIYLAYSELNERGYEQQGALLQAVQQLLRREEARDR
jgi:hypothetical protein